jgi:hypothetical protein
LYLGADIEFKLKLSGIFVSGMINKLPFNNNKKNKAGGGKHLLKRVNT